MKPWLLIPIVVFLNNTNRMDGDLWIVYGQGFRERKKCWEPLRENGERLDCK